MKIRLTESLPIEEKHGAFKGAEFEVVKFAEMTRRYFLMGIAGEHFAAFEHEFEVVEAEPKPPVESSPLKDEAPATKSVPEYSDDEKLESANEAISYLLDRIRSHDKLKYHMLHTKSLELLCEAYGKLNGVPAEHADDFVNGTIEEL